MGKRFNEIKTSVSSKLSIQMYTFRKTFFNKFWIAAKKVSDNRKRVFPPETFSRHVEKQRLVPGTCRCYALQSPFPLISPSDGTKIHIS
jgi:hypothetical protein